MIPKTGIIPEETADTSRGAITTKRENIPDISNATTLRKAVREDISKGVTITIAIRVTTNNEEITIREEATGKEDISKGTITMEDTIKVADTNKEADTTNEADTTKADTNKEGPEEVDTICVDHSKADIAIIRGKAFQNP